MSDVDASEDPAALIAYLAEAAEALASRRADSYRMLDVREGHRFLDVGCGAGEVLEDVARIVGRSGALAGVDLAEAMVDATRSRLGAAGVAADVRAADAHVLPFDDASCDRVRCERVLQHVEDPGAVVAEVFRVLALGGLALLIDANHQQADVATEDPETWLLAREHSTGQVRHPRAGLHLGEWMDAAGFVDLTTTATALLWSWPRGPLHAPPRRGSSPGHRRGGDGPRAVGRLRRRAGRPAPPRYRHQHRRRLPLPRDEAHGCHRMTRAVPGQGGRPDRHASPQH